MKESQLQGTGWPADGWWRMARLRRHIGGGAALALTIISLGCGGIDPYDGQLDVYVDASQCAMPRSCNKRYEIFVLREGCVYAWATKTSDGSQLDLEPLDMEEGTVQVLASCGTESCVRCWGAKGFSQEPGVSLALKPELSCAISQVVTTPYTECGPTKGAYCDGNRKVTCVNGRPHVETCPLGCSAGACGGECTKEGAYCDGNRRVTCANGQTHVETCPLGCSAGVCNACAKTTTFYRDMDGDTYGDANTAFDACLQPPNYVTSNTDCDDFDKNAYPGQARFFTTPTLGKKNFDYDCNNIEEQERTEKEKPCITVLPQNTCTGGGWSGSVPACGQNGTDITCMREFIFLCISTPVLATQACR